MTDERWTTPEDLAAARARLEAAIDGYERPAAYALGLAGRERAATEDRAPAEDVFPRINSGGNFLPAVVLATVCGHVRGTATYVLDQQRLQQAIDLLAPAEACTDLDHPNLAAWRQVRAELADRPGAQVVAVFLGDLEPSPTDGPYERLLRSAVRS
ncbi:hypothetical protein ACU610_13460 [Geodermatophilus sp. URMC 61]|uniref:hypothetical protein n=1 Tax=Geodermatophilus sp. URMC 61 TaxID=3423411 RepID=UPI00406C5454